MILQIEKKDVGNDVVVLELTGRITLGRDSQELEWMVEGLARDRHARIVFDLSKIKYMDSSGIGLLVMCSGKLKESGGELRIAAATGVVEQTLKLTRMNQIVPTFASVAEALSGFSAAAPAG